MVVADLADDKGKGLEAELGVRYVGTDATDEADMRAAIAEAEALGPLRISEDTHGGPASGGRLVGRDGERLDLAEFRRTIDIYLTGVFNVMRLTAAAMARQEPADGDGGRGVIVNIASIAAYEGQIGQLPYAAAKVGTASPADGPLPRVRGAGPAHLRERLSQRRGDPPGRGAAVPAQVSPRKGGCRVGDDPASPASRLSPCRTPWPRGPAARPPPRPHRGRRWPRRRPRAVRAWCR